MTVEVGTGGVGTRFIKTEWPIEEGLTLGTTKLSEDPALIPQEESLLTERETEGLR